MKKILNANKLILNYAKSQKGVFSLSDLRNIVNANKSSFYNIIKQLIEVETISQFCRGFYITDDFDLQALSQRICPQSYISFGNVLAEHLIIGSIPTYRILSVKIGKTRCYSNSQYTIEQHCIQKPLFFGYKTINGINIATPEKAFLDIIYFYQKGMKFSFDIYNDIDIDALDKNIIFDFLKKYKNKIFISLVKELLNAN